MIIRRRPVLAVAAGLLAVPLLAACGGDDVEGTASPASSSSESSSESSSSASRSPSSGTDLTPGLLPAEAFGAGAQVTPVTEAQLAQGAAVAGGSAADLQVTPPECQAAVQGTQPSFDEYDDVAAQVAVAGTTTTVQALASGGPAEDALDGFGDRLDGCSEVQVSSPQIGTATVSLEEIGVPDLGDGSAGLTFTTTVTGPDGQQVTVPALIGVVQDGERVVVLLRTDASGGQLDPTAFADLLEQAYDTQADVLD
ncbi:hypothetical protein GCM10027451_50220 [Geodermatophilus aquaeductus]|uniref:PknH-like extracellular domain-containing protein n=1 Tax=Geodermatophilus aquaeductus TaxID=1564161 RepID=A0A521ETM1_9ACTN|nr:hypothetical protein [Geodermatophilus aquaeductus]SMO87273.1 hypothetical protein SAMN06273567_10615 [Geodermatophilus aquaeductus]